MLHLVDLEKLDRLHNLIRRKATGTPEELAKRMGVSRSSIFNFIALLRDELGAPIRYNRDQCSYEYEYLPKFHLGFERDRLNQSGWYNIEGGRENDERTENSFNNENLMNDKPN